jgi:hypothetical protein
MPHSRFGWADLLVAVGRRAYRLVGEGYFLAYLPGERNAPRLPVARW